jgi:hypothetical protein
MNCIIPFNPFKSFEADAVVCDMQHDSYWIQYFVLIKKCKAQCKSKCKLNDYRFDTVRQLLQNDSSSIFLNIFFETTDYEVVTQYLDDSLGRKMSSLGGYHGLLVGASILSVLKFLELLYDIITIWVIHR